MNTLGAFGAIANQTYFFTPEVITLVAWYDASNTNSITQNFGSVSQLDDISGQEAHLIQGTGSAQPTTGARTIGGENVLDFTTSQFMETQFNFATPADGNYTIFSVSEYDSDTGSNAAAMWAVEGPNSSAGIIDFAAGGGAFNGGVLYKTTADPFAQGVPFDDPPHNGPSIYTLETNAINNVFFSYVDGTKVLDSTDYSALPLENEVSNKFYLNNEPEFGKKIDGAHGEIVIVPGVMTENLRQLMEGYLAHKWNLTANLPASHPWKTIKPR